MKEKPKAAPNSPRDSSVLLLALFVVIGLPVVYYLLFKIIAAFVPGRLM